MGILIKNNIVNQNGTPAFYESSLATRPIANIAGRMFIDTDVPSTGIYRDNGTSWNQVADPGAGTTGTLQQVTTNGSSTNVGISVSANGIGIGTTFPGTNRLDIHSASGINATFNGTGTTNSALQLQSAGVGKWNIQNKYNSGANDFVLTDLLNNIDRLTISNTGIATFIASINGTTANFSGGVSIATNGANITTSSSAPFNPSAVFYGGTGYNSIIGVDGAFSSKYIALKIDGSFVHSGGSSTFNGALTANGLYTTAGNGIVAGGNSYYINPSATRGVVALQGSTDNFLTFGTQGYIAVGSSFMQILSQSGVALSLVSDANTVLSFANTTRIGTFAYPIALNNTVTASVLNTVTNKVSIVIGGVQYYLLASTSAV